MKNEFGAWTSFLSLCFFASVAGRGFRRSCARTYYAGLGGRREKGYRGPYHDGVDGVGIREEVTPSRLWRVSVAATVTAVLPQP